MTIHETENLELDTDGWVWMATTDADGERDLDLLGDVEGCAYRVPNHLDGEFEEIREAWRQYERECRGYGAGIDLAYRTAKGF